MDVDLASTENENTVNNVNMSLDMSVKTLKRDLECGASDACPGSCDKRVKIEEEIKPEMLQLPGSTCSTVDIAESICKQQPHWELKPDINQDLNILNMVTIKSAQTDTMQETAIVQCNQENSHKTKIIDDQKTNTSQMANGCQSVELCTMIRENRVEEVETGELYYCDYCSMKFFEELRAREWFCDICGRRFKMKHHMRKHRYLIHTYTNEDDDSSAAMS